MLEYHVSSTDKIKSAGYYVMIVLQTINLLISIDFKQRILLDSIFLAIIIFCGWALGVYGAKKSYKVRMTDEGLISIVNGKKSHKIKWDNIRLFRANGIRIHISDNSLRYINIPFIKGQDYEYLSIVTTTRRNISHLDSDIRVNLDHEEKEKDEKKEKVSFINKIDKPLIFLLFVCANVAYALVTLFIRGFGIANRGSQLGLFYWIVISLIVLYLMATIYQYTRNITKFVKWAKLSGLLLGISVLITFIMGFTYDYSPTNITLLFLIIVIYSIFYSVFVRKYLKHSKDLDALAKIQKEKRVI